jgi:hypothetical protein
MSDYNEHLISMAGGDGDVLDQIQRRADKATTGPWYVDDVEQTVRAQEYAGEIIYDRSAEHSSGWAEFKPTANFIANARTDIPALLAMVREQQSVIDKVKALCDAADRYGDYHVIQSDTIRAAITEGATK